MLLLQSLPKRLHLSTKEVSVKCQMTSTGCVLHYYRTSLWWWFLILSSDEHKKSTTLQCQGCPSPIRLETSNHKPVSGMNDIHGQSDTSGWHQTPVLVGAKTIINLQCCKSYQCQLWLTTAQTGTGILDTSVVLWKHQERLTLTGAYKYFVPSVRLYSQL
jgi:hypothetical protein